MVARFHSFQNVVHRWICSCKFSRNNGNSENLVRRVNRIDVCQREVSFNCKLHIDKGVVKIELEKVARSVIVKYVLWQLRPDIRFFAISDIVLSFMTIGQNHIAFIDCEREGVEVRVQLVEGCVVTIASYIRFKNLRINQTARNAWRSLVAITRS